MQGYNCTITTSDECINNGNCKECEYGEKVCDKINLISKVDEYIEYTNDLTREMDNYLKHKSKYAQTYIMEVEQIRDRYYSALRYPGATRGHIEVDDNKNITEGFYKFGVGTNKTDIINWFNQRVNIREEK